MSKTEYMECKFGGSQSGSVATVTLQRQELPRRERIKYLSFFWEVRIKYIDSTVSKHGEITTM